ncbi:ribonuclease E activity regulator RraA [Aquisalimonas sp.]|uniref:ribonuclease E activity regulator RraA n=1 Tax=Aquisalimonas sp. TaxID=1872621 RepID=UPI0025BC7E43|nr:ribonuclease E activity regulator RraA [Aquisalimonas sp.]
MSLKTTDLCDEHSERLSVASPLFRDFGGRREFHGEVSTVKLFEDNSMVREALAEPGAGKVLVVDGGGSMRCALLGDKLAEMARDNGWSGIIVYGCIRDSADLAGMDIGVKALNTHPLKSEKKGVGERDASVTFAGITIRAGQYLYADEDGLIVAPEPLHAV